MDHQCGHTGICTTSDTSVHNIIMVKKIANSIVVTDDVHWFWASVEAFPEFGEKSIHTTGSLKALECIHSTCHPFSVIL